jgi:hypothetical protein
MRSLACHGQGLKDHAAIPSLPPPKVFTGSKTLHYPLDTIKVALASL